MKQFVIERDLPNAGTLSPEELQAISQASCAGVSQLGEPYRWIQSFVTDDKIYCIHIAESEEMVREHAGLARFPIDVISEVKIVIEPLSSNFVG